MEISKPLSSKYDVEFVNTWSRENPFTVPLRSFTNPDYGSFIQRDPRYLKLEKIGLCIPLGEGYNSIQTFELNLGMMFNNLVDYEYGMIDIPEMEYQYVNPGNTSTEFRLPQIKIGLMCDGVNGLHTNFSSWRQNSLIWSSTLESGDKRWYFDGVNRVCLSTLVFELGGNDLPGIFECQNSDLIFTWVWISEYGQQVPVNFWSDFDQAQVKEPGGRNQMFYGWHPYDLTFSISIPSKHGNKS